jgi:glycine cleavage system H protein
MNTPDELRYSSDHEWLKQEADVVRIGLTDFAQDNLGDVVYLQLPEAGTTVEQGGSLGEVESTKSVSDIYSPVAGEVLEVNAELESTPELVNRDPYGAGWICTIRPSEPAQIGELLDAAGYQALVEG